MRIKKLSPEQHESVRPLFNENDTNLAASYGVIEGLIPGQIWVDDSNHPTVCLILCEDTYCIIAGELNIEIFKEFHGLLKQKGNVRLQCEPSTHHGKLNLLDFGFTATARREYTFENRHPNLPRHENHAKYSLIRIKELETFNLCLWKQLMLDIYVESSNYLKNAIGFMLWDNEEKTVVSEAHGILSKEFCELAAVTNEKYRGQHCATIVCNHLIREVIQKDLRPIWECNETNIASWKVAEHQGMEHRANYTFYSLKD